MRGIFLWWNILFLFIHSTKSEGFWWKFQKSFVEQEAPNVAFSQLTVNKSTDNADDHSDIQKTREYGNEETLLNGNTGNQSVGSGDQPLTDDGSVLTDKHNGSISTNRNESLQMENTQRNISVNGVVLSHNSYIQVDEENDESGSGKSMRTDDETEENSGEHETPDERDLSIEKETDEEIESEEGIIKETEEEHISFDDENGQDIDGVVIIDGADETREEHIAFDDENGQDINGGGIIDGTDETGEEYISFDDENGQDIDGGSGLRKSPETEEENAANSGEQEVTLDETDLETEKETNEEVTNNNVGDNEFSFDDKSQEERYGENGSGKSLGDDEDSSFDGEENQVEMNGESGSGEIPETKSNANIVMIKGVNEGKETAKNKKMNGSGKRQFLPDDTEVSGEEDFDNAQRSVSRILTSTRNESYSTTRSEFETNQLKLEAQGENSFVSMVDVNVDNDTSSREDALENVEDANYNVESMGTNDTQESIIRTSSPTNSTNNLGKNSFVSMVDVNVDNDTSSREDALENVEDANYNVESMGTNDTQESIITKSSPTYTTNNLDDGETNEINTEKSQMTSQIPVSSTIKFDKCHNQYGRHNFTFQIVPKSVRVQEGSDVLLDCQLICQNDTTPPPNMNITWIFEDAECFQGVDDTTKCQVDLQNTSFGSPQSNYNFSILLSKINRNQTGRYICKADAYDCSKPRDVFSFNHTVYVAAYVKPNYGVHIAITSTACLLVIGIMTCLLFLVRKRRKQFEGRYRELLATTKITYQPVKVLELPPNIYKSTTVSADMVRRLSTSSFDSESVENV